MTARAISGEPRKTYFAYAYNNVTVSETEIDVTRLYVISMVGNIFLDRTLVQQTRVVEGDSVMLSTNEIRLENSTFVSVSTAFYASKIVASDCRIMQLPGDSPVILAANFVQFSRVSTLNALLNFTGLYRNIVIADSKMNATLLQINSGVSQLLISRTQMLDGGKLLSFKLAPLLLIFFQDWLLLVVKTCVSRRFH